MSFLSSPLSSSHPKPARRLMPGLAFALVAFSACHQQAARAADPPTLLSASSPRVDVEVEERAPDKSVHVAKLGMLLTDGHGKVSAKDGDARYELSAHTVSQQAEPRLML